MKKIVLVIIAALAAISASAQYTNDVSRLGIRLSWDLNSPAVSKEYKNMMNTGSGFSIGGFYDIPLTESIYFEPGLSLFYNTIGLDEIVAIDADGEQTVSVDGSVRNFGFRVPLVAGYRFEFTEDIAVSFFTGPQFNIGLTSKSRYSGPGVKVSQNNYKNASTCSGSSACASTMPTTGCLNSPAAPVSQIFSPATNTRGSICAATSFLLE